MAREATIRPLEPAVWLALVLGAAAAWALAGLYFATAHGHLDAGGHAVGRDFVILWTAGQMIAQGRAADVFDPSTFLTAARALFDAALPFHFWSYPPTALFLAAPFGGVGYFTAYGLWCGAGLLVLGIAAALFLRGPRDVALLMASPAVATNLVLGHNGFLTAALLLAGLALTARRPAVAGALIGLLSFKPQLGLLLPVAALAQRRWRLIAAAAATVVLLAALSVAAFGLGAWRAFIELGLPTQTRMMSEGSGPFQWMMPSVFMSGRLLGLSGAQAMAAQVPFTLGSAWLVWRVHRQGGRPAILGALLITATFLATPQAFNYDMIPVAAATLILARQADTAFDRLLCAVVWLTPILVMVFNATGAPITPLILALLAWRLERIRMREALPHPQPMT